MNLTEENIIGVKELNENENISLSDFVPVQKENETEIKKISLEKILLAVSKMTNEQKQILNSALALIDDENISNEKTFSSEKINSQIETVTTSKVAEIVANAPEDFNTLKEMSDWISEHQEDATAMNTAILENKNDINEISDKIIKRLDYTFLEEGTDLNSIEQIGYYTANDHATVVNAPYQGFKNFVLEVLQLMSGYRVQRLTKYDDGTTYVRTLVYDNSSSSKRAWTSWKTLATTSNLAGEKANLQSQIDTRLKNVLTIPYTETSTGAIIYKNQLVNFINANCHFQNGSAKINASIPLFITFYTSQTHCFMECYFYKEKLYIDRVISQHLSPTITINADGNFIVNIDGKQVTNIFVA